MEDGKTAQQSFVCDLQAAREYQHVSLDHVAEETHISLDFLRALEDGVWERIPAPFLRGYLTAYAECVGMVREKVLKRFDELNWQAPPLAQPEEAPAPRPVLPRIPFPARRPEPEPAPAPLHAPRGRETLVPSIWAVVPSSVKGLAAGALIVLLGLLVWGLVWLGSGPDADGRGADAPLESVLDTDAPALQGFAPFQLQLRLNRSARLTIRSQEGTLFAGLLPADSTLRLSSSLELEVQAERLEDLLIWRDGRALDLPQETGRAELRVARESVRVIRRSP